MTDNARLCKSSGSPTRLAFSGLFSSATRNGIGEGMETVIGAAGSPLTPADIVATAAAGALDQRSRRRRRGAEGQRHGFGRCRDPYSPESGPGGGSETNAKQTGAGGLQHQKRWRRQQQQQQPLKRRKTEAVSAGLPTLSAPTTAGLLPKDAAQLCEFEAAKRRRLERFGHKGSITAEGDHSRPVLPASGVVSAPAMPSPAVSTTASGSAASGAMLNFLLRRERNGVLTPPQARMLASLRCKSA